MLWLKLILKGAWKIFKSLLRKKSWQETITVKLKASILLNASLCICPLTFITEVLHFAATKQAFLTYYFCFRNLDCWWPATKEPFTGENNAFISLYHIYLLLLYRSVFYYHQSKALCHFKYKRSLAVPDCCESWPCKLQ